MTMSKTTMYPSQRRSLLDSYAVSRAVQQFEKLLKDKKQPVESICRPAAYNNNNNINNNNNNNNNNANPMKKCCRKDDHSLLKFLALNALELAAPASDVLLRQQQQQQHANNAVPAKESELSTVTTTVTTTTMTTAVAAVAVAVPNQTPAMQTTQQQQQQPQQQQQQQQQTTTTTTKKISPPPHGQSWFQLSGHPDCFAPAGPGTIWKKCSGGTEAIVYEALSHEPALRDIVPRFLREVEYRGERFIELQDLLHQFRDPHVMDIKMGTRTFLESEVQNTFAREDLYLKMIAVDPSAPTAEENEAKKVTKLRYMQFREQQSSTSTLGFRVEAMKFRGSKPVTDLKKTKSVKEVSDTLSLFLSNREDIRMRLLARLIEFRTKLEQSQYFRTHEVVGSSILIIYDDVKVGAWLIDFAKTRPVSPNTFLTHRLPWFPGNHEDGFLYGLDQLIQIVEDVHIPANKTTTVPEAAKLSVMLAS